MRYRLAFLMLFVVLPLSQAAPVPKRTNAKPAVIKAGTETNVQWIQERVASCAHIAILQDKKVADLALVRRYLRDPKDTKALVSWLEKNFSIERKKSENLVRVSFRDGNAKEQAAIFNVVVDYYLKNNVGSTRDHLTKSLDRAKHRFEEKCRAGKFTAQQAAKAEESLKKSEERIQTLPALVEHAKAR